MASAASESERQNRPLVSIMIVTWNRRSEVMRSIESARAQTYPNTEIVVVDNASDDGTADAVRERFADVRVIEGWKNLGCPTGRNLGLANCRGKYAYQLDDDGWLEEHALERAVARAESDPDLAVVMSVIHEVDERGVVVRKHPAERPLYIGTFTGCASLVRLAAVRGAGYYPDGFFRQAEEDDLAIRLLDRGRFCFLEPGSVMYHKRSPTGRRPQLFFFYMLRNKFKTGLRLFPLDMLAKRVAGDLARALKYAVLWRHVGLPFRVVGSYIASCINLGGQRRPVRRKTVKQYLELKYHPSAEKPSAVTAPRTVVEGDEAGS